MTLPRGGEWLLGSVKPSDVFTPEKLTEEHRLIARTADAFVEQEVLPAVDRLEQKDWSLARNLVKRCGTLGFLGVDVAEAYGGVDLDRITSLVIGERIARAPSFGATFGAQANLTIFLLSTFGTDSQKSRYLPGLVRGDLVGAYALSESGAGSDALSVKTHALRQPDGSFVLSGEKMWITNGGFADLFIVFAKVDRTDFSAFIVERAWGGVSSGREERKMGLLGSSTTSVVFQDVHVPAENLLGEVGKGHKIAFNVLDFARLKLGGVCEGAAKSAIGDAARYAATRKQFGRPIAEFGAIKHKIGEMVVRTYAVESLVYRTGGLISEAAGTTALEEYAIEASIAKVAGSEMLDFVLDENIQIHGGNGFVSDYAAERHYRDSRVNRIFEGTNEINRLVIAGQVAKRFSSDESKSLKVEGEQGGSRKACLMVLDVARATYGDALNEQQEVLLHLADMLIQIYAADSAGIRAAEAQASDAVDQALAAHHADAARAFTSDAGTRIEASGRQALAAMLDGARLDRCLTDLHRLVSRTPINTIAIRRRLAEVTVARGQYVFAG